MAITTSLRQAQMLADVVGMPGALLMSAWFGGRTIYVPTTTRDESHLIRKVLDDDNAFAGLVEKHGGTYMAVPTVDLEPVRTAGLIYRLSAKGVGVDDLAQLCDIAPNTVLAIRKQLRLEGFPALAELLPADDGVNHV